MSKYNIERSVAAYSKIADVDGEYILKEEFLLKPIELSFLKEIFDAGDDVNMYSLYEINESHAKALQPYVIDGKIDLDKYFYQLECHQI
jgi:hypothetical protein